MTDKTMARRSFLAGCVAGTALLPLSAWGDCVANVPGPPWNPEGLYPSYRDEKTGVPVYNLTPGGHENGKIYQTHPMWTQNMEHLVFHSKRDEGGMQLWMLEMGSGETRPVPEATGTGTMTWSNNDFYYVADRKLHVLDLVKAFRGEASPKGIGALPDACLQVDGTVTIDADLSTFYFGGVLSENEKWGIFAMDTRSGEVRTLAETNFWVGHFQANPFTPGSVMFCQESGGDTTQRIWHITADRPTPAPLYKETYNEWVTHEVWWDAEHIVFTIWPYDDEHKNLPHGVAVADIHRGPEGKMQVLARYPAWHTHGSPDGEWVLGDDFERNIWLINAKTRRRKLLTQGHLGGGCKTHPHASFTPDSRGLIFNSSKYGYEGIFYVPLPDWEQLA